MYGYGILVVKHCGNVILLLVLFYRPENKGMSVCWKVQDECVRRMIKK